MFPTGLLDGFASECHPGDQLYFGLDLGALPGPGEIEADFLHYDPNYGAWHLYWAEQGRKVVVLNDWIRAIAFVGEHLVHRSEPTA